MQLSYENDSQTTFSQERSAVTVFSNSAVVTEPWNAGTKTGFPLCLPSWCSAQSISLMHRRPGSNKGKLWTIMTAITLTNLLTSPEHKTFNAYESFSPEDPNDERILQYALCEDCILRSKKCPGCQFQNSQASMQQLLELRMIRDSVCVQKDETGIATLVCNYPVMGDAKTLYRK
jgi:hypothetical protein